MALRLATLVPLVVALERTLRVAPVVDARAVWETVFGMDAVAAVLSVRTALKLAVFDDVTALDAPPLALDKAVADGDGLSGADAVALGDSVPPLLIRADADAEAERAAEGVAEALADDRAPLAVGAPLARALAETEPHMLGRKLGAPLDEAVRVGSADALAADETEVAADAPALALLRAVGSELALSRADGETPAVDAAVVLCSPLAVLAALCVSSALIDGVAAVVAVPLRDAPDDGEAAADSLDERLESAVPDANDTVGAPLTVPPLAVGAAAVALAALLARAVCVSASDLVPPALAEGCVLGVVQLESAAATETEPMGVELAGAESAAGALAAALGESARLGVAGREGAAVAVALLLADGAVLAELLPVVLSERTADAVTLADVDASALSRADWDSEADGVFEGDLPPDREPDADREAPAETEGEAVTLGLGDGGPRRECVGLGDAPLDRVPPACEAVPDDVDDAERDARGDAERDADTLSDGAPLVLASTEEERVGKDANAVALGLPD